MNARFLLHLLTTAPKRRQGQAGFSMMAGILVLLALVVGTVGLSSLVASNLLGSREQGSSSEARSAAEAGIDEIIATWNQPQNRKLLVSGQAMNTWAGSTTTLQSPCVTTDGTATRPGGTGQPTTQAKSFGDGEFRDVENPTKVNTGTRQFALVRVVYSAGPAGNTNRRAISVASTKTGGVTTVGPSFTGNFSDLINLDDPDGTGAALPGSNGGFITVEVQGRVMRGGTPVATATVTREFEVLPKCCGASFGSNAAANLGSDKRACGVEFGLITGINGGTHFSYWANDRFTTVNKANQVVNITSMIGIVNKGETTFDRANWRVSPNSKSVNSTTLGTPSDASWWANINCAQCGSASDKLGRSISGIPIIPGTIALPTIGSETTAGNYYYTWSANGWAAATIASNYNIPNNALTNTSTTTATVAANVFNPNPLMRLQSTGTTWRFTFRTNTPTTPTAVDRPRVEVCTLATCTSTSWENVSDDRIADNFDAGTYSGNSGNTNVTPATAQWLHPATSTVLGPWVEVDPVGPSQDTTAGKVRIVTTTAFGASSNALRIGDGTKTTNNAMSVSRGINLSGFETSGPRLKFQAIATGFDSTPVPETITVQASSNGTTWANIGTITTASANTARTYVTSPIPSANVGANTRIRFINTTDLDAGDTVTIDNIQLAPRGGVNSFCEYTTTSPQTVLPGFHCIGTIFDLDSGGSVRMDTTGGPISFYYSQTGDIRGSTFADPLMSADNNATIQHFRCTTLSDNCTTPIPDSDPYSDVGVPDRLNFFGRDNGSLTGTPGQQFITIGAAGSVTGKISRAWFYFPWGNLRLISEGCSTGVDPPGFATDPNNWSINGRIWVSSFRPCGAFHFRIPPSSSVGLSAAFSTGFNPDYVQWTGVDWVARAVSSSRNYDD
ncbi:hypothetical protein KBY84_10295 [Cyanobium sp. N.Huapi 1H5]|uniref:type IV pilus modification PilV family protein n=1 Tax=Cyanobium sp. N.Huapi 1H5 TaxID=2823719 RepID=UPI0020CF6893|nr:hypothetical protein [Cyanobium sp. N.Huapi 1H5]MCP9837883.1 hypothetical protein [Cyanobium sp. N.Huapi 1H5]